jgi:hypothetical protein
VEIRPFSTWRTHNPAMQPAAAQAGRQKWVRAQARQNAARQFEHHPNGSISATAHVSHCGSFGMPVSIRLTSALISFVVSCSLPSR